LKVLGLFPKTKTTLAAAVFASISAFFYWEQTHKGYSFVLSEIGGYHHETFILFSLFLSLFFLGFGRVKQAKSFARARSKMKRTKAFTCKICDKNINYTEYSTPPKGICHKCVKDGYGDIYRNVGGEKRI